MSDLDILAETAYATGIDPITYATRHVIEAHITAYLARRGVLYADSAIQAMSACILGDLMAAGWTPPEVTR
jgi:hypothetical protein